MKTVLSKVWEAVEDRWGIRVRCDAGGIRATVWPYGRGGHKTAMKNARLMAAAPELLAACKEAVQWYASYRPTYIVNPVTRSPTDIAESLKAAIAKAEGE